jgi:YidC/Oxa1 family membrane protein insertase
MSNERRFVLFLAFMLAWMFLGYPYLMKSLGLNPNPPKKPAAPAAGAQAGKSGSGEAKADRAKPTEPAKTEAAQSHAHGTQVLVGSDTSKRPQVSLVDPKELVMGSDSDKTPTGYRLQVQLEQKGAGVGTVTSSRYGAEFEGRRNPHRPLQLIRRDPVWPPSLGLTLSPQNGALEGPQPRAEKPEDDTIPARAAIPRAEDWLDSVLWDVIRDEKGRIVRPLAKDDPAAKTSLEGQEVVFQTTASSGVVVTKTFRLWQNSDGFEVELKFESPDRAQTIAYNLMGPHGIPIEGEWYTGTFRDVFFGTVNGQATDIVAYSAYDVAKSRDKPVESTTLPLRFAGIENQYFAIFVEPDPAPTSQDDRLDRETTAIVLHKDDKALTKADVAVRISSKPIHVGANQPQIHKYRVFAGPKTSDALLPYGAEGLAGYRKNWIPFAPFLARRFIAPTLEITYQITKSIAGLFGGTRGNYGIAIILLTLFVKLLMFPLGRKQALMAQRSQELQPYLKEIQEKYKDDKEKLTRETMALWKKHGVNPVSGCIPALIQLPIFVGLWQALNTSVALRHSPFLWINDLAAPDMLFRFPAEIVFLGKWFNLLPILVVGLMLFQTKLFSPPATTPEAEMQQKTMKYMMVFMAVMFYKVPSGLGIYFITSSLWSIGERLLLPKMTHANLPAKPEAEGHDGKSSGLRGKVAAAGNGPAHPAKARGSLAQFWEKILDEARKDPTYRKMLQEREGKEKDGDRKPGSDDLRDRDRGKPRARPGRR